jgi:hypothetical protein
MERAACFRAQCASAQMCVGRGKPLTTGSLTVAVETASTVLLDEMKYDGTVIPNCLRSNSHSKTDLPPIYAPV